MEKSNTHGEIERRVMRNIQVKARGLARGNAIAGMDVQDYEQDLTADLVHRRTAFDPLIASFATFADRIIGHRVSTLKTSTARSRVERNILSLDATIPAETDDQTLHDVLSDYAAADERAICLGIDMRRFLAGFAGPEWQTCALLLDDSVSEGARRAGIHRSTAYEHIDRLRDRATAAGLSGYVVDSPDSSIVSPVSGQRAGAVAPASEASMLLKFQPVSPRLFVTETDLCRWLAEAGPGETLEYFRGFLVVDRDPYGCRLREEDRVELDRVADRAGAAADDGSAYLLQRRYGTNDFGYLIIAAAGGAQ